MVKFALFDRKGDVEILPVGRQFGDRRNDAEIERDYLLGWFRNAACGIGDSAFSDKTLDLLTKGKLIDLIEDVEKASSTLDTLLDRLRLRLDREAA